MSAGRYSCVMSVGAFFYVWLQVQLNQPLLEV
jgi:hypothetical protein